MLYHANHIRAQGAFQPAGDHKAHGFDGEGHLVLRLGCKEYKHQQAG